MSFLLDTNVALRAARLHVPDPRLINNVYIAATALIHGLTMVTRDTSDFRAMGIAPSTPWTDRQDRQV